MTLRKIFIDKSGKYTVSVNNLPTENSHDRKLKSASKPRKQNKKL